jgi:hypothetical protein
MDYPNDSTTTRPPVLPTLGPRCESCDCQIAPPKRKWCAACASAKKAEYDDRRLGIVDGEGCVLDGEDA